MEQGVGPRVLGVLGEMDMVALSPVVPQTQMASMPRAIWSSMSLPNTS